MKRILYLFLGIFKIIFSIVYLLLVVGIVFLTFKDSQFLIQLMSLFVGSLNNYLGWGILYNINAFIVNLSGIYLDVIKWIVVVSLSITSIFALVTSVATIISSIIGVISPDTFDAID